MGKLVISSSHKRAATKPAATKDPQFSFLSVTILHWRMPDKDVRLGSKRLRRETKKGKGKEDGTGVPHSS